MRERSLHVRVSGVLVLAATCCWICAGSVAAEEKEPLGPGATFKDCESCPEMVVLPQGSFTMGGLTGRAQEEPAHEVKIDYAFAVSRTEVTVAQFQDFAGEDQTGGCLTQDASGSFVAEDDRSWRKPGFQQTADHSAVCVSWLDANTYLRWLSKKTGRAYRFLSEAEWEYAALGGEKDRSTIFHFGSHEGGNFGADDESGCCRGRSQGRDRWLGTAPVGSFPPNGYGLVDLAGNVEEWIADCVNADYVGAPNDGSSWKVAARVDHAWARSSVAPDGQCVDRMVRGVAWLHAPRDAWFTRRSWWRTQLAFNFIGLRVATTISAPQPSAKSVPEGDKRGATDDSQIRQVLSNYIVGWRRGDVGLLARTFAVDHGRVMWITEKSDREVLRSMTFDEVLERRKPNPEYGLEWEVLSLDVVDGKLAVAKVYISRKGGSYVDFLVLHKIAGEWRIVNKTFVVR